MQILTRNLLSVTLVWLVAALATTTALAENRGLV